MMFNVGVFSLKGGSIVSMTSMFCLLHAVENVVSYISFSFSPSIIIQLSGYLVTEWLGWENSPGVKVSLGFTQPTDGL